MSPHPRRRVPFWRLAFALAAVAALALWLAAPHLIGSRIRALARGRGLDASWRSLEVRPPVAIAARELTFLRATGDTAARIESLDLEVDPWSLLLLSPRPTRLVIDGARFATRAAPAVDSLVAVPMRRGERLRVDRLPRIRESARRIARLLMVEPAHVSVSLRDVTLMSTGSDDEPHSALHLDSLEMKPQEGTLHLGAHGNVELEDDTPFNVDLAYERDGRLTGVVAFVLDSGARVERLPVWIDARISRGGSPRTLRLDDGSTIALGPIRLTVAGFLEPQAPHVRFSLESKDLSPDEIVRRLPATLLGPLARMRVSGTFDYALDFDLDLERPDSVSFRADVTPHGLRLNPTASRPLLTGLDAPFLAEIHLPKGRITTRELSNWNPNFRPLFAIDSTLTHAVVTNEDGAFFRHRGFNSEAVKDAIAENLHAGAYRRGAGTITMQLVRNLYLGHERTLIRKAQEVVLAWSLEHLAGISKERLLEIYLNIIEWGPGVHGANEACQYYFGHDAGRVTVDEALFLATIVPAPGRWRSRFDGGGALRPFERAQMHFIGRAMVAKGWLDPARLPEADAFRVDLIGPAGEVLFPLAKEPADSIRTEPGTSSDHGKVTPS